MEYYQPETKDAPPDINESPLTPSSRTCGLLPRTFWIGFVLVLVVLGAAIGGGVGGTFHGGKDKSVSTTPQQQSTSSAYSLSTTSTSSSNAIPYSTTASLSTSTSTGILPFSTQPGTYRIINIATNTAIDLYVLGEKFLSILYYVMIFSIENVSAILRQSLSCNF
jgi:hypothetical protein